MKIEHTTQPCKFHEIHLPKYAIIMDTDSNKIFVCTSMPKNFNGKSPRINLHVYHKNTHKWTTWNNVFNHDTKKMWKYFTQNVIKLCSFHYKPSYKHLMMKHDKMHKQGGGGSIIRDYTVTDYECSSHPLHDFQRTFY